MQHRFFCEWTFNSTYSFTQWIYSKLLAKMSDKSKFDECANTILNILYESFPIQKDLAIRCFQKWDTVENSDIFFSTIQFLENEGFIQYIEAVYGAYLGVTLTSKSLTLLNSKPESISLNMLLGSRIAETKMLDENLYDALVMLKKHETGGKCIITSDKEGLRDQKLFDSLVQRAIYLRRLGYLSFNENSIIKDTSRADADYRALVCRIEYEGTKALSFGSFAAYHTANSPHSEPATGVSIDQSLTIYGNIHGSNIATHSSTVTQHSLPMEMAHILDEIVKTLQSDESLIDTERQHKIEDIESLRKELSRPAPRSGILRTIYTDLASTASISSLLAQLWPFLHSLIGT